jgi:hypothetical protein
LAHIFAARGITCANELDTTFSALPPFDSLLNAKAMAAHLADALATEKQLLVIADYDADGATACAVAVRGLRLFGAKVDFIVPNRFEYGYGLTPEIVQLAKQQNPDILITVDNGIASVDGVAEANRLGIKVLITDHHLPGDTLPLAACIVNPNQPNCTFTTSYWRYAPNYANVVRSVISPSPISPNCSTLSHWARSLMWLNWTSSIAHWYSKACNAFAPGALARASMPYCKSQGKNRRASIALSLASPLVQG